MLPGETEEEMINRMLGKGKKSRRQPRESDEVPKQPPGPHLRRLRGGIGRHRGTHQPYLTNAYDANGRVITQTQADGTTYQYAYTVDANGTVTQTDVTDPRGIVERVTFNGQGYALTDTRALGRPEQQAMTYTRQAGTNLVQSDVGGSPWPRTLVVGWDGLSEECVGLQGPGARPSVRRLWQLQLRSDGSRARTATGRDSPRGRRRSMVVGTLSPSVGQTFGRFTLRRSATGSACKRSRNRILPLHTMTSDVGQRLKYVAFLFLVGLLVACGTDYEELWRVSSPDSRVDAVLVRTGGPATVGFSYRLFIVPKAASPGKSGEVLLADQVRNLAAFWRPPRTLELRYDEARIFSFSNFWHSKDVDNFNYVVELWLVPTGTSQLPAPRN